VIDPASLLAFGYAPSGIASLGAICVLVLAAAFARMSRVLGARAGAIPRMGKELGAQPFAHLLRLLQAWMAALVLAAVVLVSLSQLLGDPSPPGESLLEFDSLAAISVLIVSVAALLVVGLSSGYRRLLHLGYGEFYFLILLSLAGGFAALGAEHLLVVFLGLELMGLATNVLVALDREKLHADEAGLKAYFAGILSSAIFLLGMAFLYGSTGSLAYADLGVTVDGGDSLALAGVALLFAGFAMKLGLVPFHQWLPDVQQAAPTPVAVYISTCVMTTVVLAWLRVLLYALPQLAELAHPFFGVLSVTSIVIANLMAMLQNNLKRMLGWLAIAHAGTWILAFTVTGQNAYGALLFYLIAHAFAMLGAFGVVMTLKGGGRELERLEHFAGIATSRKGLSVTMTLFMLALAGVPGTAGFWAKWHLLSAVVAGGELGLAVVTVLGSVVSLYTCMRVPVMMYMREKVEYEASESSRNELAILLVCVVVVIGLGIWPDPILPERAMTLLDFLQAAASGRL
jgi:NADH-quinone oxidoreductase subunit N